MTTFNNKALDCLSVHKTDLVDSTLFVRVDECDPTGRGSGKESFDTFPAEGVFGRPHNRTTSVNGALKEPDDLKEGGLKPPGTSGERGLRSSRGEMDELESDFCGFGIAAREFGRHTDRCESNGAEIGLLTGTHQAWSKYDGAAVLTRPTGQQRMEDDKEGYHVRPQPVPQQESAAIPVGGAHTIRPRVELSPDCIGTFGSVTIKRSGWQKGGASAPFIPRPLLVKEDSSREKGRKHPVGPLHHSRRVKESVYGVLTPKGQSSIIRRDVHGNRIWSKRELRLQREYGQPPIFHRSTNITPRATLAQLGVGSGDHASEVIEPLELVGGAPKSFARGKGKGKGHSTNRNSRSDDSASERSTHDRWADRARDEAAARAQAALSKAAVAAYCSKFAQHVIVYDITCPCVALFNGEECYQPFGSHHLVTKRGQILAGSDYDCRDARRGLGSLYGYQRVHAGHYQLCDYSDCDTVEEVEEKRNSQIYQLAACGKWVTLKPFEFAGSLTDTQDLFICDLYLDAARAIGRAKTTDVQFHGTVANIAARYPHVNVEFIHNAVVHHTYDLVCSRVLANNQVVRMGQLVAANVPLPKTKENADLLGLGGFAEYSAVLNGRQMRFEKAKEQYNVYVNMLKVPGVRLDGSLCPGWTFDTDASDGKQLVVLPKASARWRITARHGNIDYLENMAYVYHGVGKPIPERECKFPYWPDKNIKPVLAGELVQTGFKSVGYAIKGDQRESHVVVYEETPTSLLDAVYARALIEIPGEDTFSMNQHLVIMHLRVIDPRMYQMVMEGLFSGNDAENIVHFMGDAELFEAEMAGLDGPGGLCSPTCQFFELDNLHRPKIDDAFLERIGRRAAAAALSERFRIIGERQRRSNFHSHVIAGAFILQFGILLWVAQQTLAEYHLVTRFFIGGVLAAAAVCTTLVGYEIIKTFSNKTHVVYSVDEAGFTHKYMRYPLFGSAIHNMWMAASRQHIKVKQYLRTLGLHWMLEPSSFMGSHVNVAMTAADVIFKKHEGSKFGKTGRFIVFCGWVTLATMVAAGHVKKSFCFVLDLTAVLVRTFPVVPSFNFEQEPLCNLPKDLSDDRPASRLICYSDDEWYVLLIMGLRLFICADASSADSCVTGAITLGLLPALYRECGSDIPLATLIYNFIRPWKVSNPQTRGRDYFLMQATNAAMPSGDSNTTHLQNIFSTMRSASFAAMLNVVTHQMVLARELKVGTGVPFQPTSESMEALVTRLIALAGHSVGGVVTVEVTTSPVRSTLLKRTLYTTTGGTVAYGLTLGPILRNFGSYAGDLTPETLGVSLKEYQALSLEARWDRFSRAVVAGLVHEPASPVLDALRYRFSGGHIVVAVDRDEKFKQDMQMESSDRSNLRVPVSEYIVRYGGTEHEWADFCDAIRRLEYGEIVQHRMMSLICAVDYGVKLPINVTSLPDTGALTEAQRARADAVRKCNIDEKRVIPTSPFFVPAHIPPVHVDLRHPPAVLAIHHPSDAMADGVAGSGEEKTHEPEYGVHDAISGAIVNDPVDASTHSEYESICPLDDSAHLIGGDDDSQNLEESSSDSDAGISLEIPQDAADY